MPVDARGATMPLPRWSQTPWTLTIMAQSADADLGPIAGAAISSRQGAAPMPRHRLYLTTCALLLAASNGDPLRAETSRQTASDSYTVDIVPSDFVPSVTNKFFSLKPGTRYLFKDKTGNERIEV